MNIIRDSISPKTHIIIERTKNRSGHALAKNGKSIKSGINRLNSILVTGPKGLILNINGEEVKIGMQDQYKLDNFDISFLGIVVTDELKEDDNFSFLIDYQYKIGICCMSVNCFEYQYDSLIETIE